MHTIKLPASLKIGAGAVTQISDCMHELGARRPLIVSEEVMQTLGHLQRLTTALSDIEATVFTGIVPEPNEASLQAALALVAENQSDCIIALGGGSAIDSAKAIALLATHGGNMRDYKVPVVVNQRSIPVIAIPTTAGTGAEVTGVTIISDDHTQEKMLCMGPGLMPAAAIIDYQLTVSLPVRVAADSGIDALTHAIEAYVSRKANLFSDQQAIAAMGLIADNLLAACTAPHLLAEQHLIAKEKMMLGATLAGMAFSNASVGLVHGMSRPLGVHFHVPHGLSNAMLLPAITEYSLSAAPQRYADCAKFMGLVDSSDDIPLAHQRLLSQLKQFNQQLNVPGMSEFGINQQAYFSALPLMAEQAQASGSPANNPRVPSRDEIIELYELAWQ